MIEGLWEKANRVSELGCRLDGVAGILELLGEHLIDNAESGTAWTCAEWLRKYGEELERLSEDIMAINRVANEQVIDAEQRLEKLRNVIAKAKGKKK